jgi:transcription elongation factor GreA-like protein
VTFVLEPGAYVRHPDRPDWGIGQVQTVVRNRVTVNFENAGKQLINTAVIALVILDDDPT